MFFQLANVFGGGIAGADQVLTGFRPSHISEFLEALWATNRSLPRDTALGVPAPPNAAHQQMARSAGNLLDRNFGGGVIALPLPLPPVQWHHIVYAYLLENTRIVDILRQVVFDWTHGERLPTATVATHRWLQATEQVFFANPWSYSVRAVTSRSAYISMTLPGMLPRACQGACGPTRLKRASRSPASCSCENP